MCITKDFKENPNYCSYVVFTSYFGLAWSDIDGLVNKVLNHKRHFSIRPMEAQTCYKLPNAAVSTYWNAHGETVSPFFVVLSGWIDWPGCNRENYLNLLTWVISVPWCYCPGIHIRSICHHGVGVDGLHSTVAAHLIQQDSVASSTRFFECAYNIGGFAKT